MEPQIYSKRALIVLVVAILGVAFVTITFVTFFLSRNELRAEIVSSELPLTSDTVYSEIQRDLIRPVTVSQMMASDTFLRDWALNGEGNLTAIQKYLLEYQQKNGAFTAYFVSNATGKYYYSGGLLKTVTVSDPHDQWFFQIRAMALDYRIDLDTDQAHGNALTIFINYKVFNYSHAFMGVAGLGLRLDAVKTIIDRYQAVFGRKIYFVDQGGRVMLEGNRAPPFHDIHQIPSLASEWRTLVMMRGDALSYVVNGETHLLNVRYIPDLGWYLFVERSEDEAVANLRHALWVGLGVALAATFLVGWILAVAVGGFERRLEAAAATDSLTGLANRRTWELLVAQATKGMSRYGGNLALIMIDIDRFKEVNDRFGHLSGDKVIKEVALRIRGQVRIPDIVCRWGGEELLILLHNCGVDDAVSLAEKIRASIAETTIEVGGSSLHVTVSAGVTEIRPDEAPDVALVRADGALYAAKSGGRNRVVKA